MSERKDLTATWVSGKFSALARRIGPDPQPPGEHRRTLRRRRETFGAQPLSL
jgi:hypothetical protein